MTWYKFLVSGFRYFNNIFRYFNNIFRYFNNSFHNIINCFSRDQIKVSKMWQFETRRRCCNLRLVDCRRNS
ncbi:hypothetical protein Hanom_Chr16g01478491 [Helianthus anomalus]